MCGIAGGVFWNRGFDDPAGAVRRMTAAQAHRGPDGEGWMDCTGASPDDSRPGVYFGHRRLAIIDLTDRAAQPMRREPGLALTYNGEIYNYRQLRGELQALGQEFHSESDTEVILAGYQAWGHGVVERLRGMFAFALWDGASESILLARDRLGIKPLYVYRTGDLLLFASETRALLRSNLVPPELDPVAVDQFLAYQTVPAPRTLVCGVEQLTPGTILTATRAAVRRNAYWDLLDAHAATASVAPAHEVQRQVRSLLAEATALHLVSDVQVGVFLSGGIDSSAIAALVSEQGITPHTFAVTFPGTSLDEAEHARRAAKACAALHTEIPITEREMLEQVPEALVGIDQPSGDGINTFIVSKAVRQAGVKVALSGLGGDEFFGGYPSFRRMDRFTSYAGVVRQAPLVLRQAAAAVVRTVGGGSVSSTKAAAMLESKGTFAEAFPILRQLFSGETRRRLLPTVASDALADPYVALLERAVERQPDLDTMALVSYAEARTYMLDVLLRDTDQMSMRHGLEVRVPLLDHRLVEYLMSLPQEAKQRGDGPKPLLVGSLASALPPACVNRRKQGFVLPFETWMRGALRPFCEHHLGPTGLQGRAPFDGREVDHIWRSFQAGAPDVSWSRPWALVALNAWMEQTGVGR